MCLNKVYNKMQELSLKHLSWISGKATFSSLSLTAAGKKVFLSPVLEALLPPGCGVPTVLMKLSLHLIV